MQTREIQTVGVIGAGTMGQGIAQVCALTGFNTLLYDVNTEVLARGLEAIQKNLEIAVDKKKITRIQRDETIARIRIVRSLSEMKVDLVIEAVVEKLEVKQKLFVELEQLNQGTAILATNTSSIPITQIASVLKNPASCIGLHFFNPVNIMKLVEVISGVATDPSLVSQLKDFSIRLGKTPVVAKDSPGFIVNRVARHFYVESLKVLEEKIADVSTIDQLMESAGFKMGPFKLMDLIGVDTNFSVTSSMYNSFHQDSKFRPSRIQQQKVDAGHWGKKTGKGFYDYPQS